MNKIYAMIPARYQSTRFPGKPLADICGKPMIQWVYERIKAVKEICEIFVATDDVRIKRCVEGFSGKCIMTSKEHVSGTDRLAECVELLGLDENDIVLNVQGDEPLIQEKMVYELMSTMEHTVAEMGTLKERILETEKIEDPNIVKVITDVDGYALYFSRCPIPYNRIKAENIPYYRHVGVYAYKTRFLKTFVKLPRSIAERTESLEQLRVLENGYKINVRETHCLSVGVDTPEQLREAELIIKSGFAFD